MINKLLITLILVNKSTLKVSVIGLGYIGLPTAAIIARKGINVNGC